jgi:hypothetical protein
MMKVEIVVVVKVIVYNAVLIKKIDMKIKNLANSITCFFLITICLSNLISCDFLRKEREFDYGIPIRLINETSDDMLVIIFPIVNSSEEVLEESTVKQVKLAKKSREFVSYYLGKNVNLKNVVVCTIAWKIDSDKQKAFALNEALLQGEPYLVKTFYDPKFELGPEKYGIFATLVIE